MGWMGWLLGAAAVGVGVELYERRRTGTTTAANPNGGSGVKPQMPNINGVSPKAPLVNPTTGLRR